MNSSRLSSRFLLALAFTGTSAAHAQSATVSRGLSWNIAPTNWRKIALADTEPAPTDNAPDVATSPPDAVTPPPDAATPPDAPKAADDGAPLTPPPAPITAPQTPAPDAPPRDLPVESPPSQPATNLENPNAILPAPPLVNVPLTPGATTPTSPEGGPIGSASGLVIPTAPLPTTPLPPDFTEIPSAPETDVASGQEAPDGNFSIESPDGVIYDPERNLTIARGKTTFSYREFSVTGDRAVVDYNVGRATIAGNLQVTARGESFQGQSLSFDLDTGRWLLSSISKTFPPELFPEGTVLEPLYIRDGRVSGQGDTARGQNFKFSSCDRDHYYLISNRIEFYRDRNGEPKRLVLRRNALYVFGRKILPLPVFVISLVTGAGSRRSPIGATAGQNETDGYFVKSFYDIRATERRTQSVLVDLLSKRGVGIGLQQVGAAGGLLYGYVLSGKTGGRESNYRVLKNYSLGRSLRSNIRLESTANNSLTGPGVAAQSGDFTFSRNGNNAQTNAIFSFNRSSYDTSNNRSGSISLDHNQNFGRGFNLRASGQVNRNISAFSIVGTPGIRNDAATADANFELGKTAKAFDLFLRAELHPDLVNKRVNQLERVPELTLQSSTDRLKLPVFSRFLPGNFTLALGRFNEPRAVTGANGQTVFSGFKENRADLFYNFNDREYRLLGGGTSQTRFRASGNFEQAFYGDDSARYNYGYNMNLINTLGNLTLQANYFNTRTFGATPFQFDFFTPSENLDYTASYNLGEKLRLNLSGGQDILNRYQRDLIFNAQFAPSANFYGSLGTSYGLENSNFGEIYGNFNFARNRRKFGGGELALGFRYDPSGRGLTRANASLDVNLGAKTRVQGLTSYDGFSKKFDFTQIRLIQDLHCFNLYANYDNERKQIRFDLALKAFPFADTRFGRNVFSEGFDSSVGIAR